MWIEIAGAADVLLEDAESPSTRRVWIEIAWRLLLETGIDVTLHAEGVD